MKHVDNRNKLHSFIFVKYFYLLIVKKIGIQKNKSCRIQFKNKVVFNQKEL